MSLNDFCYSARALIKNPAFSLLAIMTIALGVGANTSIFTAVNGVLLKSFSFPEADRLVVVTGVSKSMSTWAYRIPIISTGAPSSESLSILGRAFQLAA